MKTLVILNPYAGRWKALESKSKLEELLREAGIGYELITTEKPGDATDIAFKFVMDGYSPIIAAGGDGTISEVMNGMMAGFERDPSKKHTSMGVVPFGTANDFMVNLGLPTDLPSAVDVIKSGKTKQIDIGTVTYNNSSSVRYFDNNSAIGLEPTVTLIQQEIKWLRGTVRYLIATFLAIGKKPEWNAVIDWEDGHYEGPVSLVTVGNNPLTGGLFYMTPHAIPTDGMLTFVYGYLSTRLKILSILPRTMKPGVGSYVEHPDCHEVHSPWLKIKTTSPTPLHADGEIQTETAIEINYGLLPSALSVLVK